jgi:purine-binding chemotaxis protein CheW
MVRAKETNVEEESQIETTQYLTFKLSEELFALEIAKVREVLDFTSATKVPQTPDYLRGVINLRGSVVPVVDLRILFAMAGTAKTVNTCVIIVEVRVAGEKVVLGAMADAVQEVLNFGPDQVAPPPPEVLGSRTDFISGMGKIADGFIMILDIDKVFANSDLGMMHDCFEGAA